MSDLEPNPATENTQTDGVPNRRANYNRLVRSAKLTGILLDKLNFKVTADAYGASNKTELKRELNVTTDLVYFDEEKGSCAALINWSVAMKLKRKNAVTCSATYLIYYDNITETTDEIVRIFIDAVGKTATYAYFRALYAHLDWSGNLGSSPLPIVQFQPNTDKVPPKPEEATQEAPRKRRR